MVAGDDDQPVAVVACRQYKLSCHCVISYTANLEYSVERRYHRRGAGARNSLLEHHVDHDSSRGGGPSETSSIGRGFEAICSAAGELMDQDGVAFPAATGIAWLSFRVQTWASVTPLSSACFVSSARPTDALAGRPVELVRAAVLKLEG